MSNIAKIKIKSMQLYFKYRDGTLSLEDYLQQIKPLDEMIDKHEIKALSCYLQDNLVFEKSSSLQTH